MIDRVYGKYELSCDICEELADEKFDDFQDAVDYRLDNGWKSRKISIIWEDVCPGCQ